MQKNHQSCKISFIFSTIFSYRLNKSSKVPILHENKNYIRKRQPINFTLEDLIEDENEDQNWKASIQPDPLAKKTRFNPTRRPTTMKKDTFCQEISDNE